MTNGKTGKRRGPVTLNEATIAQLDPPANGKRLVFDHHRNSPRGFGVRVMATGSRAFILRYKSEGRDRLLTIGEHGTWTLAAARKKATELRREIDAGTDILEERAERRAAQTVADVVERYCRKHVDHLASADDVRGLFRRHLLPALGKRKIADVKRREIIALLEGIAANHGRTAALLLGYIKSVWAYAEDRDLLEGNPVATLKAAKIGANLSPRSRGRVLAEDEIRALWENAEHCGMHPLTALALKMILATGQRPGEVLGMRWAEIQGATWLIPPERRKTRTAHTVPLTQTALALLESAHAETERLARRNRRTGKFVFEARPGAPLTINGVDRAVRRYADSMGNHNNPTWGHWRPHDLRRTMRTGLAAERVPPVVAEAAIGHGRKGIQATYDLHAYDVEKRTAMEAWERRMLRIVAGENVEPDTVVPLQEREAGA